MQKSMKVQDCLTARLMSVASLASTLIVAIAVGISYHICTYVQSKNKGKDKKLQIAIRLLSLEPVGRS